MKDEANGKIITEFCALQAKLYAFRVHGEQEEQKKAKDVKKQVMKKSLTFDHYLNCIREREV